ncbi:MAG: hypothetical protein KC503_28010 [Myxococcales bacterium]|nr:hypothetical protein [Myxococcales bacterium]
MSGRVGLLVGGMILVAGCQLFESNDSSRGSGSGSSAEARSYEQAVAPFASRPPRWAGTWLVETRGRRPVAWRFDGANVPVSDGRTRRRYRLTVTAPCQLRLTDLEDSTSSRWSFSYRQGLLRIGPGHVGMIGEHGALLVCSPGAVVTRQPHVTRHAVASASSRRAARAPRCTRWRGRRAERIACSLRHDGTRPVFLASRAPALAVTVQGRLDQSAIKLLLDDDMRASRARRVPSLRAAERLLRRSGAQPAASAKHGRGRPQS